MEIGAEGGAGGGRAMTTATEWKRALEAEKAAREAERAARQAWQAAREAT